MYKNSIFPEIWGETFSTNEEPVFGQTNPLSDHSKVAIALAITNLGATFFSHVKKHYASKIVR